MLTFHSNVKRQSENFMGSRFLGESFPCNGGPYDVSTFNSGPCELCRSLIEAYLSRWHHGIVILFECFLATDWSEKRLQRNRSIKSLFAQPTRFEKKMKQKHTTTREHDVKKRTLSYVARSSLSFSLFIRREPPFLSARSCCWTSLKFWLPSKNFSGTCSL